MKRNHLITLLCCFFLLVKGGAFTQSAVEDYRIKLRQIKGNSSKLDSLNEWIYACEISGDERLGLELLDLGESLLPKDISPRTKGTFYKRKSGIYFLQMKLDSTTKYLKESLQSFEADSNMGEQASVLCRLGNVKRFQEDWQSAFKYYSMAHAIYEKSDSGLVTVVPLIGMAYMSIFKDELDSADLFLAQAENSLKKDNSNENYVLDAVTARGIFHIKRGHFGMANIAIDSSLKLAARISPEKIPDLLNNAGVNYLDVGMPKLALKYFRECQAQLGNNADKDFLSDLDYNFSESFRQLGKWDSAFHYLNLMVSANDSIQFLYNLDLEKKYENEIGYQVLKMENERLSVERILNKRIFIVAAFGFLFLIIVLILTIRYIRYKKRVALEEADAQRRADAQRIVDLIQEMDIRTLESKIEGVNEERERLAIELHDGLGSTLASIKLYFGQLEGAAQDKLTLFNKANRMLDEACESLRDYAHNLAGRKEVAGGLALVVQNLAATVSGAGSMKVQVYAHDIPMNLPQEFSRSLYKIVQELLSNAIKHSNAKNVTIQFTRHQGHLNLLVEDDGVGFPKQILSDGMGLSNVRQRVLGLGGDISIDSTPGRGATFLIDIPIDEYDDH